MYKPSLKERGISTVIGFLLVMSIFIGFGGYVLATKGRQARVRAQGLVDAMRQAEERQKQLLTFVYVSENSVENEMRAHFYNYGSVDIDVEKLWVNGTAVSSGDLSFQEDDGVQTENVFFPRVLTVVVVENIRSYAPDNFENYAFTFLTESNSLYSYLVGRR